MTTPLAALILFTAVITTCFAANPTDDEISAFSDQVSALVQAKDFDGIKELYYFDGTPPQIIEKTMLLWKARVDQADPNWAFSSVEYFPLSEYLARPNVNVKTVEAHTEEQNIDGIVYIPNTPIIGLISIKFMSGMNRTGFLYPVGHTPEGKLCFVGKKQKS